MEIQHSIQGASDTTILIGRLDTLTAQQAQAHFKKLLHSQRYTHILDASKLTYISSSGLRVLLMIQKQLKPLGGQLFITHLHPELKEIFDISGFSALFQFY